MRRLLAVIAVALLAGPAAACPEVVVPVDFHDTAFKATAWKRALTWFKAHRHKATLKELRRTSARLERDVKRLFHPKPDEDVPSQHIQRWLERFVYTKYPSVLIHDDRFTYPALVWWAWADSACRAGEYVEAQVALGRVRQLRESADLLPHEIMVDLRLGRVEQAREKLRKTPPDAFFTPYAEGLIAAAEGDHATARKKLLQARGSADLEDRRTAIEKALKALPSP